MDETRFESLRRALAAVSPRRGLMSLLGGLTLGGAFPSVFGASEAEARKAHANKKKKGGKTKVGPAGPQGPRGPAGLVNCPNGTLLHAGGCIETTKRSNNASFATARDTCYGAGRRLPTLAELETLRNRTGTDFSGSQEYTNHIGSDNNGSSTTQLVAVIGNVGGALMANQNSSVPFRCVADPS